MTIHPDPIHAKNESGLSNRVYKLLARANYMANNSIVAQSNLVEPDGSVDSKKIKKELENGNLWLCHGIGPKAVEEIQAWLSNKYGEQPNLLQEFKTISCVVEHEQPDHAPHRWSRRRRKVTIISDQLIRITFDNMTREYEFVGSDDEYYIYKRPNPNGPRIKIRLSELKGIFSIPETNSVSAI